jgi:hypothetical protein
MAEKQLPLRYLEPDRCSSEAHRKRGSLPIPSHASFMYRIRKKIDSDVVDACDSREEAHYKLAPYVYAETQRTQQLVNVVEY